MFYFGVISFFLFGTLISNADGLAIASYPANGESVTASAFLRNPDNTSMFFSQNEASALETPDLKIAGDNFLYGVSTPRVLSTQTLGDIFGGSGQEDNSVLDYVVQSGDTLQSVAGKAGKAGILTQTLLWANPDLSKNSVLKAGESLVVPPVNGVLYIVKSGDTISAVTQKYKSTIDKVIAFNGLKSEGDIFEEDVLFLPDGQMPAKVAPSIAQIPIANTFFINPTNGVITQSGHGYLKRGADFGNKCATPVYAAASGKVERSQFDPRYGNFITLSHSNGTKTYYGHLQTRMAAAGEIVTAGQMIGLMGKTGTMATGCHLHFEVRGAKNYWAGLSVGTSVSYK